MASDKILKCELAMEYEVIRDGRKETKHQWPLPSPFSLYSHSIIEVERRIRAVRAVAKIFIIQ